MASIGGKVTGHEISNDLFMQFEKAAATGIIGYRKNNITITGTAPSVNIGIENFNINYDLLFVFIAGKYIPETSYTINPEGTAIMSLGNDWGTTGIDTVFNFIAFKGVPNLNKPQLTVEEIIANVLVDYYNKTETDAKITEGVETAITNLIDSSPETLNTLSELAKALGEDPNFATSIAEKLSQKITDKSGIANFAGSNNEVTIAHGLSFTPTNIMIMPIENPQGYLGETWIRADATNIYVGNSGSFVGGFRWTILYK